MEEIAAWSEEYERKHMAPHPRNKEVADRTVDVLVYALPDAVKPLGTWFVSYIMDARLRRAMM